MKILNGRMQTHLKDCDAIVLSDYAKGTLEHISELIDVANENNIPVLVDPKGNAFERYRGATIVTPNLHEFEAVVGSCADEEELVAKGTEMLKQHGWQALLITRGENGMTLIREGVPELHLPAVAREVFDVTGAWRYGHCYFGGGNCSRQ